MSMKIYVKKVKFVRPKENPKNGDLELDADWKIDYKKMDDNSLEYVCNLKIDGEFPATFVVEGIVECGMYGKEELKFQRKFRSQYLTMPFKLW